MLMDEVLTPDSSRYWPMESWAVEGQQPAQLRQAVRARLAGAGHHGTPPWNKTPLAPRVPDEVIRQDRCQVPGSS